MLSAEGEAMLGRVALAMTTTMMLVVSAWTVPLRAQTANEATALSLFEDAKKLTDAGKYAEACPKFAASYKVANRLGTLMNLADCYEHTGQTASAWARFTEAATLADRAGQTERMEYARQHAAALAPKLSRLTIRVASPAAREEVTRDGEPVDAATFGEAFPVDPGSHVIEAKAPGKKPWSGKVDVGANGASASIDVPKLEDAAAVTATGRLRITTIPATAAIAVDGRTVGSGVWEGEVSEGTHRVEVSLPGYPTAVREIGVRGGQSVLQEVAIAGVIAPGGVAPPEYRGVYVKWVLGVAFPLTDPPTNATASTEYKNISHFGFPSTLNVGYALDPFGFELVGSVMVEGRHYTLNTLPAGSGQPQLTINQGGIHAFFGAGARVTSRDPSVRFTFGLAPGLVVRTFDVTRNGAGNDSGSSTAKFSAGYATAGFIADGGILIGSTPGTKFFLGAQAWVDFPTGDIVVGPDTSVTFPNSAFAAPGRGYNIVGTSPQVFIMPVLGIQFGH